jgi:hypothetical protein
MSAEGAERTDSGLVARYRGPNGVEVEVRDETVRYGYANIFHVRLRVEGRVPGAPGPYLRRLERMGVYEHGLDRVRGELLAGFESQSIPYLFSAEFPRRFARHLERQRQTVARLPGFS